MQKSERLISNSLTLIADLAELTYESLECTEGCAKLIRFRLKATEPRFGDTLLVVEGPEILFHGSIRAIDPAGWAMAMDPTSKLPLTPK